MAKISGAKVEAFVTSWPKPRISLRILRAKENGWDMVASTDRASLDYTPDKKGAYRAEVRIVPRHLRALLGKDAARLSEKGRIWIYSNAIYVP